MKRRLGAAALVAAIVTSGGVSAAWALVGGGTAPATFAVQLDGETVVTATGYELGAGLSSGDKREYTLRLSLQLTDNPAPAQAFQSGQTFVSASVSLLAGDLSVLKTYRLANATVVAYRQSGDAASNDFVQELVLRSRSLSIG
ncbi:MAG: hypothetical protein M5U27_05505 [Gaiella sp.]|nr:hypothetical protein [Gaiella sp.]